MSLNIDQTAPEGYEFTGEYRYPKYDEPFAVPGKQSNFVYRRGAKGKRLILRKIEYIVQVIFNSEYRRYSYIDPSGVLAVGDIVEVPVGQYDQTNIAKVAALGRGSYDGDLKTITAKYVRVEL